ncbi:hypothetical protein [Inquilinus limosus]|uniref:hypothetical protein n=1 Tax=Inquilinus limosus TaxID=171674 RepID=UPI0015C690C1|nr:hypothetical protein [Inquilinus limosus]
MWSNIWMCVAVLLKHKNFQIVLPAIPFRSAAQVIAQENARHAVGIIAGGRLAVIVLTALSRLAKIWMGAQKSTATVVMIWYVFHPVLPILDLLRPRNKKSFFYWTSVHLIKNATQRRLSHWRQRIRRSDVATNS